MSLLPYHAFFRNVASSNKRWIGRKVLCIRKNQHVYTVRFNHGESPTINKIHPDGIFVQVLPVVLPTTSTTTHHSSSSHSSACCKSLESQANQCKILLCKWNSGDFKDRYTGLINPLARKEYDNILCLDKNNRTLEKHHALLQSAKAMIPLPLQSIIADVSLVGKLRFDDPPVYDEYIYLANLIPPNNSTVENSRTVDFFHQPLSFNDNFCRWFSWDKIPFQEMPADDELWYPTVLQQQGKVQGTFTFGGWTEKTIKSFELQTVQQIN